MKKAAQFLKDIKEKDNVIIIFNNDADGVCSCTLIQKLLERTGKKKPFIISQPMPPEDNLMKKIQTTVPDKIIFLDMAVDQDAKLLKKIGSLCDMLIIDHHQVYRNLNSKNVVHTNPRIQKKGIYQSTSYLAYKITNDVTDMKDSLWIAAVGMIADYNLDDSQDVVKEIRKKYDISEGKKLYDTHLGRIADMIGAAKATKDMTMEELVWLFMEAESPDKIKDTKKGPILLKAWKKIEDEIERIKTDVANNLQKEGDVFFYHFRSEYNLRSPVSTMISERDKSKVIVVYSKIGSYINLSARNQGGQFNVGAILEKAARGLKASAGGHEAAAGAKVAEKDWGKFRERFVELVNAK